MARQSLLNNSPKSADVYPFGPLAVGDQWRQVRIDIDVTAARTGDDVAWMAEFSFDGGTTWPASVSGTFLGGTPQRLDGGPIAATLISTDTVVLPVGVNRQVRGAVTVTGATRKIPVGLELL